MATKLALAFALAAVAVEQATAGWCDNKGSGNYCRYDQSRGAWGVQTCQCHTNYNSGRRRRRSSTSHRDCDSRGDIMTCAQGCRYNNGQAPTGTGNGYSGGYSSYSGSSDNERGSCATANSVCGTSWTWEGGAAADDDTCPIGGTSPILPAGYKSWMNIMANTGGEVTAAKVIATSDASWFQAVLGIDLFQPTCTTYDASSCPWLADPATCNAVIGDNVATDEEYLVAEIKLFGDGATQGWVTVEKVGYDFVLTLTNWAGAAPPFPFARYSFTRPGGSVLTGQTDQGVHIHAGTSCDDGAAGTGSHFWAPASNADPWTAGSKYTSTSDGTTSCGAGITCSGDNKEITISGVGKTMAEVLGQTIVVHADGAKVACGVLSTCDSIAVTAWSDSAGAWAPSLSTCDARPKCEVTGTGRAATMPASLTAIGNAWTDSKNYEKFSCSRNLPECARNTAVLTTCEAKCESVNAAIGNFAAACEEQRALEASSGQTCTAAGGATCVRTAAPKAWEANAGTNGTCENTASAGTCTYVPPSFTCYTLGTDPNAANSCTGNSDPASGNTNWCNTERQRTLWNPSTPTTGRCPDGDPLGCPAAGMNQGWKRDCPALCREYQQNAPPAPGNAPSGANTRCTASIAFALAAAAAAIVA